MGAEPPEVLRTVLPGSPSLTLVDASEGADLLVVGSHGRSGLSRLVLGSVAMACVNHAPCPVVVVAPRARLTRPPARSRLRAAAPPAVPSSLVRTQQRRRITSRCWPAAACCGRAFGGSLVGDPERVTGYWTSAVLDDDGSAQVTEVIDYSFGTVAPDKHGIFRVIPG